MPPSPEIPEEYVENHTQMLAIVRMLNDMLQETAAKEQVVAGKEQAGASREQAGASRGEVVASKVEAVASRVEAVATKVEPAASKVEASTSKVEPVAGKVELVASKVESAAAKGQAFISRDAADKDKDVAGDDSANATGKNTAFECGGKLDFTQEIEALSVDDFIVTKRLTSSPPLEPQSNGQSDTDPGELFRMAEQLERDKFTFMQQNISDPRERDKVANERIQISQSFRELGNEAYEEDKFDVAIRYYSHAIEHLKDNPVLYNNRALCFYKLGKYRRCIVDLDYVLRKLDKKNLDSWLFRAAAYKCLDDHHNYERSIKNARKFNINSVEYIEECVEKIRSGEL